MVKLLLLLAEVRTNSFYISFHLISFPWHVKTCCFFSLFYHWSVPWVGVIFSRHFLLSRNLIRARRSLLVRLLIGHKLPMPKQDGEVRRAKWFAYKKEIWRCLSRTKHGREHGSQCLGNVRTNQSKLFPRGTKKLTWTIGNQFAAKFLRCHSIVWGFTTVSNTRTFVWNFWFVIPQRVGYSCRYRYLGREIEMWLYSL